MNLLIIGHSVEDHINFRGREEVKPGGIYYTAAALLKTIRDKDVITLITSINKNNFQMFNPVYSNLTLDKENIMDEIPIVNLEIKEDSEREETFKNLSSSLRINLANLNKYRGVLINMITGFDLSLNTLSILRENFFGKIYFDVHSLSRLKILKNGKRRLKLIENFKDWAVHLDLIQVNETELFTLYDSKKESEIAENIITRKEQYLIITRGSEGASVYYSFCGKIEKIDYRAPSTEVKNLVGCGDTFGAVFFYTYIATRNIKTALEAAVDSASVMVSYDDILDVPKFEHDLNYYDFQ